ncbi:hypothetical protein LEP1GSC012_0895 [Leptospira interrogans serovar Valbuzzi str. Valbuzzi]|nr:hypothetical protein LEP1GSC012_0895 [Leptospira interrogans serovar Valbuzzi str. Valbuzzi]
MDIPLRMINNLNFIYESIKVIFIKTYIGQNLVNFLRIKNYIKFFMNDQNEKQKYSILKANYL